MFDSETTVKIIIDAIMRASAKDLKAYEVIGLYHKLTSDVLDEDNAALLIQEIERIEEELKNWIKDYPPNKELKTMTPAEGALCLINDLRKSGIIK